MALRGISMFFFTKPDKVAIAEFCEQQRKLPLSYHDRLATRWRCPPGYAAAHYRVKLGSGSRCYLAACEAIRNWKPFPHKLLSVHPEPDAIALGTHVVLRMRTAGLWVLMCSEIVDVFDDHFAVGDASGEASLDRFGFAYGTKPGHAESGEERFCVEWFHDDDSVWYDLRSFSRPQHWLVWAGLPFARHLQRRFARYSLAAMVRAVTSDQLTRHKSTAETVPCGTP